METLVVLANLSRLVTAKMDKFISHVLGWINGRIEVVVARSYSCMIHISRIFSPLRYREMDWDPESGLGLAQ